MFVLVVNSDCVPGKMYGPYDFEDATAKALQILQSDETENGPIQLTDKIKSSFELDGFYNYPMGGGVYLVQSE